MTAIYRKYRGRWQVYITLRAAAETLELGDRISVARKDKTVEEKIVVAIISRNGNRIWCGVRDIV